MKRIKINIRERVKNYETRWHALTLRQQKHYTILFFAAYTVLSVVVLVKSCFYTERPMNIRHIENPSVKSKKTDTPFMDSASTDFKQKFYERKWK